MTIKMSWIFCFHFLPILIMLNMDTFSTLFVSLNFWMSLYAMNNISSLSSLLKKVASSTSLSLKTIKSRPFFKISSLFNALHFQPPFFLEARRLKLFVNCFINSSIVFECLHPNKLISSLSPVCLFTSLFWRLFGRAKKI
jgi:hypothetical protein